jgi:hypothetical protein
MNTDNLTIAEVNFVKNLLSGLTDEQIIADQPSKTIGDALDFAWGTMISMGYKKEIYTIKRTKMVDYFLNGKTNRKLQDELYEQFKAENTMQLLWSPERMASKEYEFKVERNTKKSYIKVASQLVERGLLEGVMVVHIKKGEGIAEALIEIRNR